jgi:hypothetical protein
MRFGKGYAHRHATPLFPGKQGRKLAENMMRTTRKKGSRKEPELDPALLKHLEVRLASMLKWSRASAQPKADLNKLIQIGTKLGRQHSQTVQAQNELTYRLLNCVHHAVIGVRIGDKSELQWQLVQPGARRAPGTVPAIIADLIKRMYGEKLGRSTLTKWTYAVCEAIRNDCKPGEVYAFLKERRLRNVYADFLAWKQAVLAKAAGKLGAGSGDGRSKPEAHASSIGPKRKGRAASSSAPPLSAGASRAVAHNGRATVDHLMREVVARRAEIVHGAESCLLTVCERYQNGKLIEVKIFEIPQESKRATRPNRRPAAGRRRSGSSIVANVEAGKRSKTRSAM